MAKKSTIIAVKVLGDGGSGALSWVISGIDWVTQQHKSKSNKKSVANVSLGGGKSTSFNEALQNSVAAGVLYGVSAGNSNKNACLVSPGSAWWVMVTGSTTRDDKRSSFSNYGNCLEL